MVALRLDQLWTKRSVTRDSVQSGVALPHSKMPILNPALVRHVECADYYAKYSCTSETTKVVLPR